MKNLKVGCGKFLFGQGAIDVLVPEIRRLGGKPMVIGGETTLLIVMEKIAEPLAECGIVPHAIVHREGCTMAWAKAYGERALAQGITVLVGVGGGKCLDLAKCAATFCGLPVITVPTSIATCAACSAFCVMYHPDGKPAGPVHMEREIDVVVADSGIIAQAPPRLLAAGIFDSISKLPEVIHGVRTDSYRDCGLQKYISVTNSKGLYEFLMGECEEVFEKGTAYPRFEELILANLLHTGVISGFSAGLGQQALAHGLYNYIRRDFTREGEGCLHGEIVGVGILMQCGYNGMEPEELEQIRQKMENLNLPTRAEQVGFVYTKANLENMIKFLMDITKMDSQHKGKLQKAVSVIL